MGNIFDTDPERVNAEAALEPLAVAFTANDEERCQMSVAISLKRIADTLERFSTGGFNGHFEDMAHDMGAAFRKGAGQ